MQQFENELVNIPKWFIKGYEDFFFCTNKKLHNTRTKRVLKKRVKCCSVGYELKGKFITLKNLRPLIIPVERMSQNNKRSQVLELNDLIMALAS